MLTAQTGGGGPRNTGRGKPVHHRHYAFRQTDARLTVGRRVFASHRQNGWDSQAGCADFTVVPHQPLSRFVYRACSCGPPRPRAGHFALETPSVLSPKNDSNVRAVARATGLVRVQDNKQVRLEHHYLINCFLCAQSLRAAPPKDSTVRGEAGQCPDSATAA